MLILIAGRWMPSASTSLSQCRRFLHAAMAFAICRLGRLSAAAFSLCSRFSPISPLQWLLAFSRTASLFPLRFSFAPLLFAAFRASRFSAAACLLLPAGLFSASCNAFTLPLRFLPSLQLSPPASACSSPWRRLTSGRSLSSRDTNALAHTARLYPPAFRLGGRFGAPASLPVLASRRAACSSFFSPLAAPSASFAASRPCGSPVRSSSAVPVPPPPCFS